MLEGCIDWPVDFAARYRKLGYWRDKTLGELLSDRARVTPTRLAVVDGEYRWTYRELDERADRLAAGLRRRGIAPQQRVLVQLPNIAEFLCLCFALFRIGAIPVLALPAHRKTEIVRLAQMSESVAYVIADTHMGFDYRVLARTVYEQTPSLQHVFVAGDAQEFVSLSEVDAAPEILPDPDPHEVAVLLLSGGTTGLPKLIPRTHDDYIYNAGASAEVAGMNADTRYLVTLPIAHNFALASPGALGTLYAGGAVVFCKDPSPDVAFPLIEKEKITVTALVPPLVLLWLEAAEWDTTDLNSLQWLQVGGARLKAETAAQIRPVLGCGLQQVYGMAEGLLNFTRLDDPESVVFNTQGRPIAADDEVRIVDTNGIVVAEGTTGELLVRGPYTIRGYYCADQYNQLAFTADGFYRSGDLVRRLPGGHLVVEGRCKDVINRGGDKIPVEEVENYLLAHPAVHDVAIVGIPDETLGERSCACIVTRDAAPSLAELTAYLRRSGLAAFKLPDQLRVLNSFPRTGLGKVNKQALAKQVRTTTTTELRTEL